MRWKLNVSIKHFAVFCCWLKSKHRFILFFSFNFIYIFIQLFVNGFWEHVSMPKKSFFCWPNVEKYWQLGDNGLRAHCFSIWHVRIYTYMHNLTEVRSHSQPVSQPIYFNIHPAYNSSSSSNNRNRNRSNWSPNNKRTNW